MSFKMTVMVIFWIVVSLVIIADLTYMLVKSKKEISKQVTATEEKIDI